MRLRENPPAATALLLDLQPGLCDFAELLIGARGGEARLAEGSVIKPKDNFGPFQGTLQETAEGPRVQAQTPRLKEPSCQKDNDGVCKGAANRNQRPNSRNLREVSEDAAHFLDVGEEHPRVRFRVPVV